MYIYNDRYNRVLLDFSKDGGLEDYKASGTLFSEISNTFAYLLTSVIFLFGGLKGIVLFTLLISLILAFKSIYDYDRRDSIA